MERSRRVEEHKSAPAGKLAPGSAKAQVVKAAKATKATTAARATTPAKSPIDPSVAKPAAKTSPPSLVKSAAPSPAKSPAKSQTIAAAPSPAPSPANNPEKPLPKTPARAVSGGPAERSEPPADRLPPVEPTEKPRRGLGALGKRAFSGPAPVLPLLNGPRTPSKKPGPAALPLGDLPAVAAGALPRDAIEFLRAELHALLAFAEEPPTQP